MNGLPDMSGIEVRAILTARAVAFGPNGEQSAIDKKPVLGAVAVGIGGLNGDEHGDLVHHGGADKAVHQYPFDHYAAWIAECPELASMLAAPGAFGENLSTLGMTEKDVCIGDIYRLGSTVLQVSQTRNPCWRLNGRFGETSMARRVQDSARVGWYYRVLEPGEIAPGDRFDLIERPHADWPLTHLLHHLFVDKLNFAELERLAGIAELADAQKQYAIGRLKARKVEDWGERLTVPG